MPVLSTKKQEHSTRLFICELQADLENIFLTQH